jgi:tripartite-type tricarboxylate transporter receptor subunit TctC
MSDRRRSMMTAAVTGILACCASAAARAADDFYKGRTLTIAAPNAAGGGYDTYVRALAQFLPRYIPGAPQVIVQNVPAAGGMVLANQLYVTAPRDGSYIGMLRGTVLQNEVFQDPQVQFKSRNFGWLANMNSDVDGCVMSLSSGISKISDLYSRHAILAATGAGAQSYTFPIAYQKILGMNIEVIAGFAGTPDRLLAMQRGEVNGACGISISTFLSQVADMSRTHEVTLVAQAGLRKDSRFPDVPNMLDEARTQDAKDMMRLLFAPLSLGRPIAAPPGIPKDRLALLQTAVAATMRDRDFIEAARRAHIDIQWSDGAETTAALDALSKASPAAVSHLKAILQP